MYIMYTRHGRAGLRGRGRGTAAGASNVLGVRSVFYYRYYYYFCYYYYHYYYYHYYYYRYYYYFCYYYCHYYYYYGQFSRFHVCFCGLDPGNLKFETVRTNKQHICF